MVFKCKMCGGDIEPIEGTNTGKCLYCKSVMTLPNLDNEKIVNLYNRANKLRLSNEFDKAYATYESILEIDNDQVEAHWGLILCKYGVEYVDDPRTKKKVPTCHRANYDSVLVDSDYLYVREKAYGEALKIYEEEAKKINHIQKGILDISSKEEPYDIFICYKETDKDGERTKDSVLAQDIYDALTKEGYKVFFSRITLEEKLGTEYEPYIFAALNSAKVMLVVGTSPENMESVWVKNEWSRYLEFMKKDKSKSLIPVYQKIDAYDLPDSFSMLQAQSMDKIGAMQDLIRGVGKIISASKNVKKDELDKGTAKKVQDVLEGATSLGNDRYEVTVVKEKRATWYYIFLVILILIQLWSKLIVLDECFGIDLFEMNSKSFNLLGTIDIYSLSKGLVILQSIVCLLFVVIGFIKMRSRKLVKLSNYLILIVLLLEFLTIEIALKYACVAGLSYWFTVALTFVLLFVNPKWQLDTSTKTIVEGEEKDKLLAKNKSIREKFKKKDKFPFNKIVFIIAIVICIVIYGITLYNSLFQPHGNERDTSKLQVEITASHVRVRKTNDTYSTVIGLAKAGETYTILSSSNGSYDCGLWYQIKQDNGVTGYICGESAYVKMLNDQSNERDSSVKQLEVINDYIRIRKDSSLYSDALGKVVKGEVYTILEDEKQYDGSHWYKIKTRYGIEGYIYSGDKNEYVRVYNAKK